MLKDLVKQCRSYRRFYQDTVIPYSELADMVDTARLAASASNAQALKFKNFVHARGMCRYLPVYCMGGRPEGLGGTRGGRETLSLYRHCL